MPFEIKTGGLLRWIIGIANSEATDNGVDNNGVEDNARWKQAVDDGIVDNGRHR